jgi:hypothetical protein
VMPDRCAFLVNSRYAASRSRDEVLKEIKELVGADSDDIEVTLDSPAALPSLGHPLFTDLARSVGVRVRPKLGWTDAGRLAQLGLPAVNFGPGIPPSRTLLGSAWTWTTRTESAASSPGMRFVRKRVVALVVADESLLSVHDALNIVRHEAVDVLALKLQTHGASKTLRITAVAEAAGLPCMIGCSLECEVAVSASAAVAASRGCVAYIDLDAPLWLGSSPVHGGVQYWGTTLRLPEAPGARHHRSANRLNDDATLLLVIDAGKEQRCEDV